MHVPASCAAMLILGIGLSSPVQAQVNKAPDLDRVGAPYLTRDPDEVVITDIGSWRHPVKNVLKKHGLTVTEVELMWKRTFPVFHVATLGGDPVVGASDAYFHPLLDEVLKANGQWSFKLVSDDHRDGFLVLYNARTRTVLRQPIEDEGR